MRRLLFTGAIAAGTYAVVAILMVVGNRFLGGSLWVPEVIYLGLALYEARSDQRPRGCARLTAACRSEISTRV